MSNIQIIGKIPGEIELKKALESNIIPLKFCYLGKGASKWNTFRNKEHTRLGTREESALVAALSGLPKKQAPVNLIHIGVGNGVEIPILTKFFGVQKDVYIGVDISQPMIQNTIINQAFDLKKFKSALFFVTDVEVKNNLKKVCQKAKTLGNKVNILLVSGEGTLCSNPNFIKYLAQVLTKNDLLLITLEGDHPAKRTEILDTYNLPSARNLIRVGLKMAKITGNFLPAEFDEKDNLVKVHFKTKAGKQILCLSSYKPSSKKQFNEYLSSYGLKPNTIQYIPATHAFAALCNILTRK